MNVWSLVTCQPVHGETAPFVGAVDEQGRVWHSPMLAGYADVGALMADWTELEPVLRSWDATSGELLESVRTLAPVPQPGKLVCAGANYRDHIAEMGIDAPAIIEPYFFLLPPTSIVGPGEAVEIPDDPTARVDWEAELGVVIGTRARNVPVERALDVVGGYTIVNDISARGHHARANPLAPPFAYDWLRSKGRDTFTPVGPAVTPAWFVPDPQMLSIRLWRNGVREQDGNTKDMITSVAELISWASAVMTLEPGDVLATGTPAGVGARKGIVLEPGDELTIEIEKLGELRNPVRLAERAAVGRATESTRER